MPAIVQQTLRLVGELTAFNAVGSDGWGHGVIAVGAERHRITGKLLGVRAGDTVELEGSWRTHPQHGEQFAVRLCTATTPKSSDGVVAWMASTLPDLGPGRARQLVERFGDQLWSVIEHDHLQLTAVAGITPARALAIHQAHAANRATRDNMVMLRGWGLTDAQIGRCLDKFGELHLVVKAIRENPYQLSQTVYGFGFKRADAVAMKAGVKFDSPERCAAALEHVLDEATLNDGHVYLTSGELRARTVKLLGVPPVLVNEVLRTSIRRGRMVRRGARIYTLGLDAAEQACADALRELLDERGAA